MTLIQGSAAPLMKIVMYKGTVATFVCMQTPAAAAVIKLHVVVLLAVTMLCVPVNWHLKGVGQD